MFESENANEFLFSVVVPVYNVEEYVAQCLDSVLAQDRDDFEVVIVDDGSTDGSGPICDTYASRHPGRVKVIHQPNRGPLLARRRGYESSSGRYLLTIDSDDMLMAGALDVVADAVKSHWPDVVRFGYTRDYGDWERCAKGDGRFAHIESCVLPEKEEMLRLLCTGMTQNSMCAKAVRRECADIETDYSRYEGMTFAEDFLQTLAIYDKAETFCVIDAPLYYYRPNPKSATMMAYRPRNYHESSMALEAAAPYAAKWEKGFGCPGLEAGIARQGLWQASKYAVYLAQEGNKNGFDALRTSGAFLSRWSTPGARDGLRIDQKIELRLLAGGAWVPLRVEALLKGAVSNARF